MKQVILTCDRCKKVVKCTSSEPFPLYTLSLVAKGGYGNTISQSAIPPVEWCRDCIVDTGFVSWKCAEDKPAAPTPTLEDFLRDIINQEIDARQ